MPAIAPILEQTVNKIRFSVDQVKPAPEKLPTEKAKLLCEKYFEKPLLAFSHRDDFPLVPTQAVHPFVQAVHLSFSQHRPLIITPDIVWITLAQGFAQHVNNHAEALRSRFVSHQGKRKLVVEADSLEPESWSKMILRWALQIGDHVGAELCNLLECNFTTTTPVTRTASYVVMMDTFQKYFDYEVGFICGITDITFEGTVEDWQSIYDRIQYLAMSLELMAGFIGVHQTESGQLRPEIGWAVTKDIRLIALLDKIQQEHITNPPINWQELDVEFDCIPKDIVRMLSRFDGAILYAETDHPWQLDRYDPKKTYKVEVGEHWPYKGSVTHFMHLENKTGRCCLAYFGNWIVLGTLVNGKLENTVLIADSLANLFSRIFLEDGAYYFDSPEFVPISISLEGN